MHYCNKKEKETTCVSTIIQHNEKADKNKPEACFPILNVALTCQQNGLNHPDLYGSVLTMFPVVVVFVVVVVASAAASQEQQRNT